MFSGEMLTGPILIAIFIVSIIVLLALILKFKLNAFISLLIVAYITGLAVNMPLDAIVTTITNGFGATLGSIGLVTGLGVILGMLMFESGGIESITNRILKAFGEKKSPYAVALSGFITGIPVFGDVVYIMFAPMLRMLSKKTKISMVTFSLVLSIATTCTFALVLPTAPPLAVAEELGLEIGVFFFYALICAAVGTLGSIVYGQFINKIDQKNNHFYTFEDLEELENEVVENGNAREQMGALKALSILLVPIVLILLGSFIPLFAGKPIPIVSFIGDKNFAMLCGVLYASIISRKYLRDSITNIMTKSADQIGLVLLITGAGGAFGKILQGTGIADYIASSLSQFNIPILVLCFMISQIIRCAQGSTTVSLITTAAILSSTISQSSVSPILCAIAICAGGIGLSMPNDSGFWAISRFFKISVADTLRGWSIGGFIAGINILIFVSILSMFQQFLPGLL